MEEKELPADVHYLIPDFRLLRVLFSHLLRVMLGVVGTDATCSIHDALESMSCVSHLLFIIFHEQKSAFISTQLYHDLQSSCKALYVAVAHFKEGRRTF